MSMEHDIFFSISQTPDENGHIPDEATMLRNYFQQLACADDLGFGVGWIAQAHLSTETQKSNQHPVVPHWNRFAEQAALKSAAPLFPSLPQEGPSLKRNAWPTC